MLPVTSGSWGTRGASRLFKSRTIATKPPSYTDPSLNFLLQRAYLPTQCSLLAGFVYFSSSLLQTTNTRHACCPLLLLLLSKHIYILHSRNPSPQLLSRATAHPQLLQALRSPDPLVSSTIDLLASHRHVETLLESVAAMEETTAAISPDTTSRSGEAGSVVTRP